MLSIFYVYTMKKLFTILILSVAIAACKKEQQCGRITKIYIPYSISTIGGIHVFHGNPHIAIEVSGKEIDRVVSNETYLKIKTDSIRWWCF